MSAYVLLNSLNKFEKRKKTCDLPSILLPLHKNVYSIIHEHDYIYHMMLK